MEAPGELLPKPLFNIAGLMRLTPGQRLAGFTAAAAVCVLVYLVLFSMLSHGAESQISTFAFIAPLLLSFALFGLNHIFPRAEGRQMSAIGFDHPSHRVTQSALGFGGGVMLILYGPLSWQPAWACAGIALTSFVHPAPSRCFCSPCSLERRKNLSIALTPWCASAGPSAHSVRFR
jgi:hypothetical protein